MIRTLRRKFIVTAMLSLLILIIILITCITAMGYYQMERSADAMLHMLSQQDAPTQFHGDAEPNPGGPARPDGADDPGNRRRPVFGYQLSPGAPGPTGHFIATADSSGQIDTVRIVGLSGLSQADASAIAADILASGNASGRVRSYKYLVTDTDSGKRLVFLDNSVQLQMLLSTLATSCAVGAACLALMFVIVFLLSGRAIRPIADNMQKQRQFVTDAGHEIKTPLAIIISNTDALELHQGESRWSRNIRSQAERMDGLMKQLLLLARTDEGASVYPLEELDLSALAQKTTDAFAEPSKQAGLSLQPDIAAGITVHGNAGALEQLLHILLDNAVKYAECSSTIELRLAKEGKRHVLTVANRIEALPAAEPAALFDRFYRADAARTQKTGGYGIGLSAAQAIVQLHHGKISASYEGLHTIRFRVELP